MPAAISIRHSFNSSDFSNIIARSNNRIGLDPTNECAAISGYHRNETCHDEQRSNSHSVVNNIRYTLIIKLGSGKFRDELIFGMSRVTANNRWTSNNYWTIVRNCVFVTGLSD